ncbi:MAG: hypothetical protein O9282_05895 [Flavobacterium sp.]|uniref:hypothetical protein n=1 Tax=Flavobacterium sp. TaxID=239 RepID=UPI0022C29874|nr:hypothetical protein [Flavobacterium sp.]MCZ8330825.1 hypothetical protein [Flavobacterium sp.]
MKKIIIFITILIIILIAFAYFININLFDEHKFSLILDLLDVIQVIITIYIAFLLYDRLGTSRKLFDKQNEIVIEYIEMLKILRLNMYQWTDEHACTSRIIRISRNTHWINLEKDIPVLFNTSFHSQLQNEKLNDLINHPLFPVEIKNDVDLFNYGIMTSTFSENKKGYVFISFNDERDFNMNEWMYSGNTLDDCVKVNQFMNKIQRILDVLENWANKESSIKIKLNFD